MGMKNVEFSAAECKTFGIAKSIGYVKEKKSSIFATFYLFRFCEAFIKGPMRYSATGFYAIQACMGR